jgi:hypothetical protein
MRTTLVKSVRKHQDSIMSYVNTLGQTPPTDNLHQDSIMSDVNIQVPIQSTDEPHQNSAAGEFNTLGTTLKRNSPHSLENSEDLTWPKTLGEPNSRNWIQIFRIQIHIRTNKELI